ncbi:MAG: hypothetical protein ACI9P7_000106 [Candidatus Azotimanducaceae bacterium]|jgi:hypothetical protein
MTDGLPVVRVKSPTDEIEAILRWGRGALIHHPEATRLVFKSLIEEGRRFSTTPKGKEQAEKLAGSALAQRARFAWDLSTVWLTDHSESTPVPSNFIDGLMLLADNEDMESVMQKLYEGPDDFKL